MSWLGWLNFCVLQWFCTRLQRTVEILPEDSFRTVRWDFIHAIPLTGWWTRYRRFW